MSRIDFDLYLIADPQWVKGNLIASVKQAMDGGVRAIQLRIKNLPPREILKIGEDIKMLTEGYNCKLFINDRIDIAMIIGAEGVHLGQNSISPGMVRNLTGGEFIIGVSTHTMEEAKNAETEGADFVTFGPIFETESKLRYGAPVGLDRLSLVTEEIKIPIFAIGGIRKERIKEVMDRGSYGVALISAILNDPHPDQAAAGMLRDLISYKAGTL